MAYFNVCILVKKGSKSNKKQLLQETLAKFDINKKVKPYKYYLKTDEIQRMSKHFGTNPTDFITLATKLEDWNCDKGGVDKKGLYGISTKNPDGHIDGWSMPTEIKSENLEHLLCSEDGCLAIITPDDKWHNGPHIYKFPKAKPNAEWDKKLEAWDKKIKMLLNQHINTTSFVARCHL